MHTINFIRFKNATFYSHNTDLVARMKKFTKMSESTVCILLAANLHI